jgi:alpha-D-xyloside xylohydrolase
MFGPDILVAPILWEGARSRKVYLPKGAKWSNPYTDEQYEGGQWIVCDAPLEIIPVFLKNGAVLPIKASSSPQ